MSALDGAFCYAHMIMNSSFHLDFACCAHDPLRQMNWLMIKGQQLVFQNS